MELADVVGSIRRHWKVSVLMILIAALGLGIFLVTQDQVLPSTEYSSTAQIRIPAPDSKGNLPPGVPFGLLQGQAELAVAGTTQAETYQRAGVQEKDQDNVKLSAGTNETGDVIYLSVRAGSPQVAAKTVTSFAAAYSHARSNYVRVGAIKSKLSLTRSITVLSDRLDEVEQDLRTKNVALPDIITPTQAATRTGSVDDQPVVALPIPAGASREVALQITTRNALVNKIRGNQAAYARAEIDSITPQSFSLTVQTTPARQVTPPSPSPLIPIGAALGIGLLLAAAVPVLMDRLDHTIKDARTAGEMFGAPVLSLIPATSRSGHRSLAQPGSAHDAAFRALAATSVATDRLPRAILVTAPSGNVQDMVAANFASALASLGLKVALVATTSEQSWFLDGTSNGGEAITFPDLLNRAHQGTLNGEVEHSLATSELANMIVIPPGSNDDLDLPLDGLPPLLAAFEQSNVDVTVIAGPALLDDPNTTIFAWSTRSVLWAIETGEVTHSEAEDSAERLELAGVVPFGVALVGREV